MNSSLVEKLTAYFATNGTLDQVAQFSNAVMSGAWGQIAHLAKIVGL